MSESHHAAEVAFSPEELRRRCLENVDLARRVLRTFLEHGEQELASLQRAEGDGQVAETAKVAHRLKGASDNVAAHRLCRLATLLEQAARSGSSDRDHLVEALGTEWRRFQEAAHEFLLAATAGNSVSSPE